ncbi:MAG: ankyrin repeat domain-containing protein [Legionella sp.]|nr:ankyrin repeat domain-containing protein [Legionella sp.]
MEQKLEQQTTTAVQSVQTLTLEKLPYDIIRHLITIIDYSPNTLHALQLVSKEFSQIISRSTISDMLYRYFVFETFNARFTLHPKNLLKYEQYLPQINLVSHISNYIEIETQKKLLAFSDFILETRLRYLKINDKLLEGLKEYKSEYLKRAADKFQIDSYPCIEQDKQKWIDKVAAAIKKYPSVNTMYLYHFKNTFNWEILFEHCHKEKYLVQELKKIKFFYEASLTALSTKNIYAAPFLHSKHALLKLYEYIFKIHGLEVYFSRFKPENLEQLYNKEDNQRRLEESLGAVNAQLIMKDFADIENFLFTIQKFEYLLSLLYELQVNKHLTSEEDVIFSFFNNYYLMDTVEQAKGNNRHFDLPIEFYYRLAKGQTKVAKENISFLLDVTELTHELKYLFHETSDSRGYTVFDYAKKLKNVIFLDYCRYEHFNAAFASQDKEYIGTMVWENDIRKISRLQWIVSLQISPSEIKDAHIKPALLTHKDIWGNTVLHYAAKNTDTFWLKRLLKIHKAHNLSIEPINELGYSPLHFAAMCGNYQATAVLLQHGLNKDLVTEAKNSPFDLLLRAHPEHWQSYRKTTLVHVVARFYDLETLKLLNYTYDYYVNVSNKDGQTPLHHAILSKKSDNIINLLERGADVTIKDELGLTPENYLYLFQNHYPDAIESFRALGLKRVFPEHLGKEYRQNQYSFTYYLIEHGINLTFPQYLEMIEEPSISRVDAELHFIGSLCKLYRKQANPVQDLTEFLIQCLPSKKGLAYCPILKGLIKLTEIKNTGCGALFFKSNQKMAKIAQDIIELLVDKKPIVIKQNDLKLLTKHKSLQAIIDLFPADEPNYSPRALSLN